MRAIVAIMVMMRARVTRHLPPLDPLDGAMDIVRAMPKTERDAKME